MTKTEETVENTILWKQKYVLYSYTKAQGKFLYTVEQYASCATKENVNLSKILHTFQVKSVKSVKSAEKRNSHTPENVNQQTN